MSEIVKLSILLEDIKRMYKDFIKVIKNERVFIVNTKSDEYSEILSDKISISKQIERCDSEIEKTILSIKSFYNIKEFSFQNINKLSSSVNKEEQEALFKISEIKGELKEILTKVTKENKFNEELLLEHIEFANNIMKIFETNSINYSKSGISKNRSHDGGFIDRMG